MNLLQRPSAIGRTRKKRVNPRLRFLRGETGPNPVQHYPDTGTATAQQFKITGNREIALLERASKRTQLR